MGGGDVDANPRLRRAIDLAKANNMPAENITRAIKKGTGELEGVSYEELQYEGVGPGASLLIVEVTTDNRNRTAAEIRKIFDKHQGQLGASGSSSWAFDDRGVVSVPLSSATEEKLFEVAVGAGAEDITSFDDQWVITTPREALDAVRDAVEAEKIPVDAAEFRKIPKTPKTLSAHDAEILGNLIETLEDHDDVQKVFTDAEPEESV